MFKIKFFSLSLLGVTREEYKASRNTLKEEGVGSGHPHSTAADDGHLEGFLFEHSFSIAGFD